MTPPTRHPGPYARKFQHARVMSHGGSHFYNPSEAIAKAIREALDPNAAAGKCKTLSEMTDEERRRIEERFGAKIAE